MAHWPMRTGFAKEISAPRTSGDYTATTLTGGAINTKGAYTQLVASTSDDVGLLVVRIGTTFLSATNTSALVDISVGAAGVEQVLIPNLAAGYTQALLTAGSSGKFPRTYHIPIYVAAGTRISARCQGAQASKTVAICVDMYGTGSLESMGVGVPYSRCVAYGVSGSLGTSLAITANTWAQVTASTSDPIHGLFWGVQCNASAVMTAGVMTMDLGYGAAAAEQVLMTGIRSQGDGAEYVEMDAVVPILGLNLPAGVRLAVRPTVNLARDTILYGLVR